MAIETTVFILMLSFGGGIANVAEYERLEGEGSCRAALETAQDEAIRGAIVFGTCVPYVVTSHGGVK